MKRSVLLRLPRSVWLFFLIFLASDALPDAAIEGTVQLAKKAKAVPVQQRYQVNSTDQPAQADAPAAVVYLEGAFPAKSSDQQPPQMTQRNLQFMPGLLPIQVGTTVRFPNMDETYHNVFSYSKTKRFDLGRYRKDETPAEVTFEKPGVVKLYCEIHEHMRATILVLETPYFTKTDPEGKYRLEKLPPGKHTLKVWIDENTVREHSVELKPGETVRVDSPGKD